MAAGSDEKSGDAGRDRSAMDMATTASLMSTTIDSMPDASIMAAFSSRRLNSAAAVMTPETR